MLLIHQHSSNGTGGLTCIGEQKTKTSFSMPVSIASFKRFETNASKAVRRWRMQLECNISYFLISSQKLNDSHRITFYLLILIVSALFLFVSEAITVSWAKSRPVTHQAWEIEVLVNKAAEVLEERGSKAFEDFRKKGSSWRYGDIYIFVVDMRGIVLFNAALPNREGQDLLNERDADGKRFHRDFVDVALNFGSGWVDYMFPKPGQSIPTVKWSYVRSTRVDDVEALVGAGVYID